MISFSVPGKPCAKQSVRFTKSGRRYQPGDVLAYRDKIGWYARQAHSGDVIEGPIKIEITAAFLVPGSWSKKRKLAALWHAQKPDVDNLTKAVLDGLKGVVIRDDAQVCKLEMAKVWVTGGESILVTITPLGLPLEAAE